MEKYAVISDCGQYRYSLLRRWDRALPVLAFVMLNPSTADAIKDDATIRKCIGFGTRLGYGAIVVVNLFAYRATDPKVMKAYAAPVGPENDFYIRNQTTNRDTICAWGSNAKGMARTGEVLRILAECGVTPKALQINAGNIPAHPLMLPYTCTPKSLLQGLV